jgi:hypothetical protein
MFALVLTSSLVLGAPALKDERKPDKPPPGKWEMVRFEHDGEPMCPAPRVSLTEKSLRYGQSPQPQDNEPTWIASYFRVAGERQADFVWGNRGDGLVQSAIWKVDGEYLVICMGPLGEPSLRPTAFAAPKGSLQWLYLFRRVGD